MAQVPTPELIEYFLAHLDDNKKNEIIAVYVPCLFFAYAAVILRFVSRRLIKTPYQWDDWTIVIGLVFSSAFAYATCALITLGYGRHANYITDVPKFAKLAIFAEVIYNPGVVAIKGSILLLYARLFPGRQFRLILWPIFAFVVAYSITQSFLDVFQCVPVAAVWDPTILNPRCINLDKGLVVCSSINIATDVIMLCLPLPKLWALKISTEKKVQLMGIFLLGSFVCIVSIIRATVIKDVSLSDPSWSDVNGGTWTVVECCVGIVTACLPTLRPMVNLLLRGDAAATTRLHPSSGDDSHHNNATIGGGGSRFKLSRGKLSWGVSRLDDDDSLEMTDAVPFAERGGSRERGGSGGGGGGPETDVETTAEGWKRSYTAVEVGSSRGASPDPRGIQVTTDVEQFHRPAR